MISQPHITDEQTEAQGVGTLNNLQKVSEFILSQELDRDSSSSGEKDRLWGQAAWIYALALPLLNVWPLASHCISLCLSFPDLESGK